jgi:peptidoglycan/xylan/chitin deacetylase (PgdA/CDA1 family)
MFWAAFLRALGVLRISRKWVQRQGAIVLTFHRVLTDEELHLTASLPGMIVRRETFDDFLKYAAKNCDLIQASKEPEWSRNQKLKVAITFDDGWSDNATSAYPIAQKHGAPMAIFVVPRRTGTVLPFWPERAASALDRHMSATDRVQNRSYVEQTIERLKGLSAQERQRRIDEMTSSGGVLHSTALVDQTMTWEQIAKLKDGGVVFGSHTSTHEILTGIPQAQAQDEISLSRELIEGRLNAPCSIFSYPNGDFSHNVRELVARAGYRFAFLNQDPGVWTPLSDPYLIPRVNVCEYHLVDDKGKFSPLMFDYAVVWNAAKGLLAEKRATVLKRLGNKWRGWTGKFHLQSAEKNRIEKSSS